MTIPTHQVLLLEDDPILSREIKIFFENKNISCQTVFDGELFLKQQKQSIFDIYLLDINVPKINGMEICKKIRSEDKSTPIIFLTAYGELEDKIECFNLGADDYIVKPFHLEELFVRVKALLRRNETAESPSILKIGDLEINDSLSKVSRNGKEINLTPKEYNLLKILAEADGRIVSKQIISDKLWDYHIETNLNTIEVYINFLRNKIDKFSEKKLIHTKVGFGYYLKDE